MYFILKLWGKFLIVSMKYTSYIINKSYISSASIICSSPYEAYEFSQSVEFIWVATGLHPPQIIVTRILKESPIGSKYLKWTSKFHVSYIEMSYIVYSTYCGIILISLTIGGHRHHFTHHFISWYLDYRILHELSWLSILSFIWEHFWSLSGTKFHLFANRAFGCHKDLRNDMAYKNSSCTPIRNQRTASCHLAETSRNSLDTQKTAYINCSHCLQDFKTLQDF